MTLSSNGYNKEALEKLGLGFLFNGDTFESFIADEMAFMLVDNDVYSIRAMSDCEVRESIVADLLDITMYEKEHNEKCHFGFTELVRFLSPVFHDRIKEAMKHEEIAFMISRTESDDELRIRLEDPIRLEASRYCGVYYGNDTDQAEGPLYRGNVDALIAKVVEAGSFDALVAQLAEEIEKDVGKH